jgi:hypothetical protein
MPDSFLLDIYDEIRRARRLATQSRWQKAHPDVCLANTRRWTLRHPEHVPNFHKKWANEHKEYRREYQRAYNHRRRELRQLKRLNWPFNIWLYYKVQAQSECFPWFEIPR